MKAVSGRELAKAVERAGWQLLRVQGSHHIYGKTGTIVRLSIPMHEGHDLKRGLLLHLMKQAGIREEDL